MKTIVYLLCIFLFFTKILLSIEIDVIDPNKEIQIEANKIEILERDNNAFLIGNVLITQNALKFKADKMNIVYTKQNGDTINIKKIFAENNVKIKDKNLDISGDIGVYDFIKNKIILEKNIVVYDGLSKIYGNKLEYNILNETFTMIRDEKNENKQVQIIIDDIDKMEKYYDNKK